MLGAQRRQIYCLGLEGAHHRGGLLVPEKEIVVVEVKGGILCRWRAFQIEGIVGKKNLEHKKIIMYEEFSTARA